MPNWVTNIIEVSGKKEDIDALMQRVRSEESGFDFNTLIPMPESLNVTSGGSTPVAILYYISNRLERPINEIRQHKFSSSAHLFSTLETEIARLRDGINNGYYKPDKLYADGKVYVDNLEKYGAPTWYEWANKNWGTKWNACDVDVSRNSPTSCSICFDTAWSLPEPIIIKLVEEYPQLDFDGKWADEDLGSNCGHWESCDGVPVFTDVETLRFACEVWGYDYDEIRSEYGYDEDEEEEPAPIEVEVEEVAEIEDIPCSIDELIEASHSVLNEHGGDMR